MRTEEEIVAQIKQLEQQVDDERKYRRTVSAATAYWLQALKWVLGIT